MTDLKQRLAPLEGLDMPERWNEIRDRAPRAGFDPEPPRRRPIAVMALALVLTVATIGWIGSGFRGESALPAIESRWESTTVPRLGLGFEHPGEWEIQEIDHPVGHISLFGTAASNVPVELRHPDIPNTETSAWDMSGLPPQAVLVVITSFDGGPAPDTRQPLVAKPSSPDFPLSLDDVKAITEGYGAADGRVLEFVLGLRPIRVEVWFGPNASESDRRAAERLVSTIWPLEDPSVSKPEPELEPTLDLDAVDVGLEFGICDAASTKGAFTGTHTGRAWFGTTTDERSLQCSRSSRDFVLAVDIDGDGVAEGWIDPIGPNVCWLSCELTGVSDLDGDGTDELVLLLEGGAVASFGVVDVDPHGRLELMGYVDGDSPQGVPGNGPVKLVSGGDEAYSFAVSCTIGADGPVIRQEAVAGVVEQPELGATVTTAELVLKNDGFVVVRDDLATGVTPPPTLASRSSLCDLELPAF